ncbi:MAG: type II secretion system protein [Bdellovibrionales bacterium]|nr:type II secretion system protein [Bdellovibrionales bacterium]
MKVVTKNKEAGIFLIELLVVIGMLGVFGLALTKSSIVSLRMRKTAQLVSQANQIALDTLEEFAAKDSDSLADGESNSSSKTVNGMEYEVQTLIDGKSDGSKVIYVDVTALTDKYSASVSLDLVVY